jgi:hypothetical protein
MIPARHRERIEHGMVFEQQHPAFLEESLTEAAEHRCGWHPTCRIGASCSRIQRHTTGTDSLVLTAQVQEPGCALRPG